MRRPLRARICNFLSRSLALTASPSSARMSASSGTSRLRPALNFLNNQDAAPQKAVVDFDSTHVLVLSGVYQLPFGNGKRFFTNAGKVSNLLFGGWEYTWIANFRSGRPIPLRTSDIDLIGDP